MPPPASILRLLVIDDDPLQCELLLYLLGTAGFDVVTEGSGSSAMTRLKGGDDVFDAILTDLQMPAMDGRELAARVREWSHGAILVGMSAKAPLPFELQTFDAFLTKPFTASELHAVIGSIRQASPSALQQPEPAAEACAPPFDSGLKGTRSERGSSATYARHKPFEGAPPAPTPRSETVLDKRIFGQLHVAVGVVQLRQLYEMTANDVDSRLSRMFSSLHAGDHPEIRREAHAIKGSCAMVGAIELSRLAARIETGSETVSAQLTEMQEACMRLRQMVTIVPP